MSQRHSQLSFMNSNSKELGGSTLKGNPRHKRPFDSKKLLHVVLKSSLCKGSQSMLHKRYQRRIQATLHFYAKRNNVKIYRYQNVGNHLHIILQTAKLINYTRFIKALSGRIAQVIKIQMGLSCSGGDPTKKSTTSKNKFWDYRPFSRVVGWGKDFQIMKDYILKNTLDFLNLPRTLENLSALKYSIAICRANAPPKLALQISTSDMQMKLC
jgi:REP element-mobilizing transposase RayT